LPILAASNNIGDKLQKGGGGRAHTGCTLTHGIQKNNIPFQHVIFFVINFPKNQTTENLDISSDFNVFYSPVEFEIEIESTEKHIFLTLQFPFFPLQSVA
jgi:hypothetical protein